MRIFCKGQAGHEKTPFLDQIAALVRPAGNKLKVLHVGKRFHFVAYRER